MKVSALPSCNDYYDTRNARSLVVTSRRARPSGLQSPLILMHFPSRDSRPLGTGSSANSYLLIQVSRQMHLLYRVFLFEHYLQHYRL